MVHLAGRVDRARVHRDRLPAGQVPGKLGSIAASRGMVLFCGSASEERATMQAIADDLIDNEGAHALSSDLLVWRAGWSGLEA